MLVGQSNLKFHSRHVEMSTVSQYERHNSYCNKKGMTEILVGQTTYSLTLAFNDNLVPTSQQECLVVPYSTAI